MTEVILQLNDILIFLLFAGGLTLILAFLQSLVNIGKSSLKVGKSLEEFSLTYIKALRDGVVDEAEKNKLLEITVDLAANAQSLKNKINESIENMNRIARWFVTREQAKSTGS